MWFRALGLLALCLWPALSWAALAIDAVSSSTCGGCTSLSWSHTVTGASTALLVGTSNFDTLDDVASVTYNAASLTEVPSSFVANGSYSTDIFSLIAPTTGTNTVLVTGTGGAISDLGGGAISFTGAHQTSLLGTAVTATGTDTTPTVNASSAAGEVVMDTAAIVHSGTFSVGAGQTSRWNGIATSGFIKYAGSTETGSTTTTMSWSNSTSQVWAISAVAVKPASAGVTTGPPMLRLNLGGGK